MANSVNMCAVKEISDVSPRDSHIRKLVISEWNVALSIKPRLHDTTSCHTGCTTGLTTGCIV